jgi:hypothetical protein
MTTKAYEVKSTSTESIRVEIEAPGDPTGGAVEFAYVLATSDAEPSGFVAGSWDTPTYDADTNIAYALTPTLPLAGSGFPLAVGVYHQYTKRTVGTEIIVDITGRLTVSK